MVFPIIAGALLAARLILPKVAARVAPIALKGLRAFIPATLKGKIFAGTATLLSFGILKESPTATTFVKETIKDLPQAPGKVIGFGGEVGKVIEGEKTFGKEDILEGAKKAGVVGAVVAAGAIVIPKILGRGKGGDEPTLDFEALPAALPLEKEKQLSPDKPITPETETIEAGVKKKRSRRRTQPRRQTISQRVSINVGVNAHNRKLIRNVIFT